MLFPQANQIINTDRFRRGSLRLLLLSLLFFGAGSWLFFGTLVFYATSLEVEQTADNYIQAAFDQTELASVAVGQLAEVQLTNEEGELISVPARILAIDSEVGVLTLQIMERMAYLALFAEETAVIQQVRIERQVTSPSRFIFSAAGLI
ncbi:MAG: hypothetical protein AAF614_31815 [Chloroflexota bacterium]